MQTIPEHEHEGEQDDCESPPHSPVEEDRAEGQQSVMRQATEAYVMSRAERRRSRRERIKGRRGAFRWLPIKFSNDLVHGSWWFVVGSVIATLIPIVPLVNLYYNFWGTDSKGSLPLLEDAATFGLLIASGFFFTMGSLAFVRATEEPMLKPLFSHISVHMATDELLAAWLFLFATIPFVPFMAVYVWYNNQVMLYWGCLIASIIFVIATYFFVLACYPSDREERRHQIVPMIVGCFCKRDTWGINKHLSNDWLAGTWFFFWATLVMLGGSVFMLVYTLNDKGGKNHLEIFDWATSTFDSVIFLIGSAYFCAGSYPQGIPHPFFLTHGGGGDSNPAPPLYKEDFKEASPVAVTPPSSATLVSKFRDADVDSDDASESEKQSLLTRL